MTTNEVHDLAALYVVDALTVEESAEFENHLVTCVECQLEVTDMRSVTEKLSRSVQADPPASLRSAVLASIASTTQEAGIPPTVLPAEPAMAAQPAAGDVVPIRPLKPRRPSRLPHLLAAAAVIIAVGFGGWALQSHHDAQQATAQQSALVNLFGASDVRTVSGAVPGGGSATVVLSDSQDKALFVTAGMPALPSDKVYELWTITDKAAPAGTFEGSTGSVVTLPSAALSANKIAVTVEPKGGSQQPTTAPVMTVNVPPSG